MAAAAAGAPQGKWTSRTSAMEGSVFIIPGGNSGAYFKTSVDDGAKNHALENNSAPLRDGKKLTRDDLSKKPLAAFSHGAARRGMFGVFHLWWA